MREDSEYSAVCGPGACCRQLASPCEFPTLVTAAVVDAVARRAGRAWYLLRNHSRRASPTRH